jgi:hypothetical protein
MAKLGAPAKKDSWNCRKLKVDRIAIHPKGLRSIKEDIETM